MSNPANSIVLTGRLSRDPKFWGPHADGSRTCAFTLMVRDDFVTKSTGQVESQAVEVEAYVPASDKPTVYDMIHKGDLITLSAQFRSSNFVDKTTGEKVYKTTVSVQRVQMLESKAVTNDRRIKNLQETAAPAPVQSTTPVQAAAPAPAQAAVPTPNVPAQVTREQLLAMAAKMD